jgi:hypothetical protein
MLLTNHLVGHTVARLRLIFRICGAIPAVDRFLAYVQRYNIIPQPSVSAQTSRGGKTDPITGLYALKRALRADKSYLGDVIPVSCLRAAVQLIPRFGTAADSRLTMQTSLEYSTDFWLNKYEDKEIFWSIHVS